MNKPPAVRLRGLRKAYGTLQALAGIDLTIDQGEFFGLLGPNGAGKSTLISILAGLVRRDSGVAEVLGLDVDRDYRQTRRLLGVVPQELAFDPFFTVREVLRLQAGYFGRRDDAWIEEVMTELDLTGKANANLRTLSGGMRRRVLIAQALVHRPPIVILDEPTAGVDVELRQGLWRFMRHYNRQGHTVILTTHYLEEAEELCNRIGILDRGRLVALDRKEDLLARFTWKTLTVTFASPPGPLPEPLAELLTGAGEDSIVLRVDRRRHDMNAVLTALQTLPSPILDLHVQEPDLEDAFLHFVEHGGEAA